MPGWGELMAGHAITTGVRTPGGDADMQAPMSTSRSRFEALYAAHGRAILGSALRRVSRPADAADVVAEPFLVAWRRLDDVPPGAEARPWLSGVARRTLANHRRGERRRQRLGQRLGAAVGDLVPGAGTEPGDALEAA